MPMVLPPPFFYQLGVKAHGGGDGSPIGVLSQSTAGSGRKSPPRRPVDRTGRVSNESPAP